MLTKLPQVNITPGSPYEAAIPERVVCPPTAPDAAPIPGARAGYYATLCIRPVLKIDGELVPSDMLVCTRVWVDTGG